LQSERAKLLKGYMVYAKCLFCCEKYEKCLEITNEIIEFGMPIMQE